MAGVNKKKGENFDSLLRRFQRRVQDSGNMIQAKKVRFRKPEKSKTEKKSSALHRISAAKKRSYLERIGKLPDEKKGRSRAR